MSSTNAAKIAKSGLWLTASFALAKCSQLIAQIFLARLLSPEDFGVWGMVLIITTLSALFKDAAIAGVLVQRGLDNKKLVDAVYSLGVNISVGMFIVQALAGYPLAQFFGVPVVWPLTTCAALVFLLGAGAGSHGAVLQRQMKFRELAIADSVAGLARLGGALGAAAFGAGVWSFAVAEIALTLVDALLKRWLSGYHFKYHFVPDSAAVREVQGYIRSLVGINLAVYANTNGDNLIVGKLLGAQSLGYYNLAYQLAMLPAFALSQINRINFSVLAQRDNEGQRVYVCQMLELYALFYAPVYGLALAIAPWLIPFVYGPDWVGAVSIFQIVLVFAYARGFMAILGTALNALDKPSINAAINWALVPLALSSFWVGAQVGELMGVAIAVALVMGVGATAWFWLAMCRAAGWSVQALSRPVILPTLTITVTVAGVLTMPLPLDLQPYLQPLLIISIYAIALCVVSLGRIPRMLLHLAKGFKKTEVSHPDSL